MSLYDIVTDHIIFVLLSVPLHMYHLIYTTTLIRYISDIDTYSNASSQSLTRRKTSGATKSSTDVKPTRRSDRLKLRNKEDSQSL